MNFLGSRLTLLVGVALLVVSVGLIFTPVVAWQNAQSVQQAADANASRMPKQQEYADGLMADMQGRLAANPSDYMALSNLGLAYLQKARETNDPSFYTQAEEAFAKALALQPGYYDATAAYGSLELSRHNFNEALEWGAKARDINPNKSYAYGVVGDALIELGRYDEAVDTVQQMVDLRPDLSSYSRISYVRELYGDVPGAIEAMRQAVSAGSPAAENTAWSRVQLGNLYFNSKQLDKAELEYNGALQNYPGYLHAIAGLAQVRTAQGNTAEAVKLYKQALAVVPFPQYLVALGDLYEDMGDTDSAKEQYDLALYTFRVYEANGVDAGIEKAAFLADRDRDAEEAVKLAEAAATGRQDVHTLDTLAWALYRAGRYQDALAAEQKAMRLGTQNALFYFHSGMIYSKLGDAGRAIQNLQKALDINPNFSVRYVKEIRSQKSEVRSQKSEIRSQKSEVRSQKSEVRSQKSEIRSQKSEIRSQKSEVRNQKSEVRSQKSEVRNQKSEIRNQKSEVRSQR